MAFLNHFLAAVLVLTGTSWCQTVRTAPIRIRTVPGSVQGPPVSPIARASFQNLHSPSLAAPAGLIAPVAIAPLSLPAPEIAVSAPSLGAAVPVVGPGSLESRIQQLGESMAVPLKMAGDDKVSPDGSRQAGQEIEKALAGETPVEAQGAISKPEPPRAPSDEARWIAARVPTASRSELREILNRVKGTGSPFLAHAIWAELVKPILGESSRPASSSELKDIGARWHKDSRDTLHRRMPTLATILEDPAKLSLFLQALSFLRLFTTTSEHMIFPHYFGGAPTPVARSKDKGIVFELNELRVVPLTESFRRHVLYVEDSEGFYGVQIKMPGENADRHDINMEHFTAAAELWNRFPEDPGVVKPLYFGRFKGTAKLYGQELRFSRFKPLGIALWEYEDVLRGYPRDPDTYRRDVRYLRAAADIATAAIRLHRLGWRGTNLKELWLNTSGKLNHHTDMHTGNVEHFTDGRARLAADFGAFRKSLWKKLGMLKRRLETRVLLGYPGSRDRDAIAAEVTARLGRGIQDPRELARIREEVRQELGLE